MEREMSNESTRRPTFYVASMVCIFGPTRTGVRVFELWEILSLAED